MFKRLLGTTLTRLLSAAFSLLIVILNTNFLRAEKVGSISLILLGVVLILLLSNFIGGGGLVYFIPRKELGKLYLPSLFWAIFSSVAGGLILWALGLIPAGYELHVIIISFLACLFTVHSLVLLGKERITQYNIVFILQVVLVAVVLILSFFVFRYYEVMAYVLALYVSYGVSFLLCFIFLIKDIRMIRFNGFFSEIREVIGYGTWIQVANIFQMMNYRAAFYLIETLLGSRALLGIYAVGVQLSEGLWMFGKSMAMVEYARIANATDQESTVKVTISFLKLGVVITTIMITGILLLPTDFFRLVFGSEFGDVRYVMLVMAPGIVGFVFSIVLSSYFSGIGCPRHNTISSALGLVLTFGVGLLLIPPYGIFGAGLAASLSYISTSIYQVIVFIRMNHLTVKDFLLHRGDIAYIRQSVRDVFKSNSGNILP
ncbi:MAG: hypothetical protein FJY10_05270 [Bacteroidetes bacterium]|nr:hypothetical protein [Bacteroidota bacterium]